MAERRRAACESKVQKKRRRGATASVGQGTHDFSNREEERGRGATQSGREAAIGPAATERERTRASGPVVGPE
jgi:hypothetical protein